MKWVYSALIVLTLLGPVLMSFEKNINFAEKWGRFLAAVSLPAAFFIVWDVLFTAKGIWSFNSSYHLGINILFLPLEEWLFFLAVPFACVFIYEVTSYYVGTRHIPSRTVSLVLLSGLALLALIFNDRLYTVTTFALTIITVIYHEWVARSVWLGKFYLAWLVCLIPFIVIDGILTALPVVMYNDSENMGLRLGTIPFEDIIYGMLLILLTCSYYLEDREGEAGNELYINNPT